MPPPKQSGKIQSMNSGVENLRNIFYSSGWLYVHHAHVARPCGSTRITVCDRTIGTIAHHNTHDRTICARSFIHLLILLLLVIKILSNRPSSQSQSAHINVSFIGQNIIISAIKSRFSFVARHIGIDEKFNINKRVMYIWVAKRPGHVDCLQFYYFILKDRVVISVRARSCNKLPLV